jgi:hypothetical protein
VSTVTYECDKCRHRTRHASLWGKSHGSDCTDKKEPGIFRMVPKKKRGAVRKTVTP